MGFGFVTLFVFDLRKTGIETGGGRIWWNALRPVHGVLYLTASYFVVRHLRVQGASVLAVDTALGLCAFLWHHYAKTRSAFGG